MSGGSKRWLLLGLGFGLFGLGILTGRLTTPSPGNQVVSEIAPPREIKISERVPLGRDKNLNAKTLGAMGKVRTNTKELEKMLSEVDASEIPGLLDELAKRAGVSGLSYKDEKLFDSLIEHWYKLEPGGALQWVLGMESQKDRSDFSRELIGIEMENDLDRAVEIAKMFKVEGELLRLPSGLFQKAVKSGTEQLLEIYTMTAYEGSSASGNSHEYPDGFDFKAALDGLVAVESSLPDGNRLNQVPSNLVEEWAKRDPQAALDWVSADHDLSFNDLGDFIEGYAEVAKVEEMSQLAAELFDGKERDRDAYRLTWDVLREMPEKELVLQLLQTSNRPGSDSEHLAGMFAQSGWSTGSEIERARRAILSAMPDGERLSILAGQDLKTFKDGGRRKELATSLSQLGHSQQEIDALLPKEK